MKGDAMEEMFEDEELSIEEILQLNNEDAEEPENS